MKSPINLLPWRAEKRKRDKSLFIIQFFLAVFFTGFSLFLFNKVVTHKMQKQSENHHHLNQKRTELEKQVKAMQVLEQKHQKITQRIQMLDDIASSPFLMLRIFDAVGRIIPSHIVITKMEKRQHLIQLYGYAQEHQYIAEMMQNIQKYPWIKKTYLAEIKRKSMNKSTFQLIFQVA